MSEQPGQIDENAPVTYDDDVASLRRLQAAALVRVGNGEAR